MIALDAELIAACTASIDQPRTAPDPRLTELAGYLTFLEQLEEDIARFKTRLEHIDEPRLRRIVIGGIILFAPVQRWGFAPRKISKT